MRDVGEGARERPDPVEEVLRCGHAEERQDGTSTRGLPRDRDAAGITAEGGDVLLHPLEGSEPVAHASVRGCSGDHAEPVDAETIRDRHRDDTVAVEAPTVVPRTRGRAGEEAAAVDPDEYREPRRSRIGGEDVDVQRRRARNARLGDERHPGIAALGGRPERERIADAVPPLGSHGRREAALPHRRLCERDAEERRRPFGTRSAPLPAHRPRGG